MPNYAFTGSYLDPTRFRQALPGLSPASQAMFDLTPGGAYEYFMSFLPLSSAQDFAMRRLFDVLRSRYEAQAAAGGPSTADLRWIDFLASVDPQRELARMPREFRGELQAESRFNRQPRYQAF